MMQHGDPMRGDREARREHGSDPVRRLHDVRWSAPPVYTPDPAEEAWYASPEGKRNTARLLRSCAARDIATAERLEREADNA